MKDEIKILFLKNVGNPLDGESFKYIVEINENNYIISNFNNTPINSCINSVCYDFDELSIYNQQRYEKWYIKLKRVNENIYSVQTKTYKIKRDLFT